MCRCLINGQNKKSVFVDPVKDSNWLTFPRLRWKWNLPNAALDYPFSIKTFDVIKICIL